MVITLVAAFLQNARSMLQKDLTGRLSVNGASYARFVFALPFAGLYLAVLGYSAGLPEVNGPFFAYVCVGAVTQILATSALLAAFTYNNFAVGTAYSKTEVVQTALVGLVVLGEPVTARAVAAIAISFFGVWLLCVRDVGRILPRQVGREAVFGIASGACFAVATVSFRGAALALPSGGFLVRAAMTLAIGLCVQTLVMSAYLAVREPRQIRAVMGNARRGVWVGLTGMAASTCWFSAMTLQTAALVRAVGQVELIFTYLTSVWLFRESVGRRDLIGVTLLAAGILLLLVPGGSG